MSEWLKALFVSIFGTHSGIATFIISMIPIVELRGAIPFGSASSFWGANALPLWQSFLISLAGSSVVCVILTFLFWPIFNWLKKTTCFVKLANWIENKLKKNSKNINNKTEAEKNQKKITMLKIIGVFGFVALPLPLTGVWTGTCLALFIGLSKKQTLLSVLPGNLVAGLLMMLISYFFKDNTSIVFYAFFAIVAVFVLYEVVKALVLKLKNKKSAKINETSENGNLSQMQSQVQEESVQTTEGLEVDANDNKNIESQTTGKEQTKKAQNKTGDKD